MPDSFHNKYIIGGISLAVIAVILYIVLSLGLIPGLGNGRAVENPDRVNTDQILIRLNRLRNIRIETDVFQTEEFAQLIDFGVQIQAQQIGRDNPFLPVTYTPSGEVIIPNNPTAGQNTTVNTTAPRPQESGQETQNQSVDTENRSGEESDDEQNDSQDRQSNRVIGG